MASGKIHPFETLVAFTTGGLMVCSLLQSKEVEKLGYEMFLINQWIGGIIRYNEWRSTWDLTEEQDYIKGYAT